MTKLTSYLIFLGCLSTILVPELNFGLDELLNGKEIVSICIHLYTPLAVIADIFLFKNAGITACAVEQSKPIKLVISHNVGFRFSIKFLYF